MHYIQLIKILASFIPLELVNCTYFMNAIKWVFGNIKENYVMVGKVGVSEALFNNLKPEEKRFFTPLQNNQIFYLNFSCNKENFSCRLNYLDGAYILETKHQTIGTHEFRLYAKAEEEVRVQIERLALNHDFITDYDVQIYYNSFKSDVEAEKDGAFARRFNVPFEDARELRTNFDTHKTEINMLSKMNKMRDSDDALSDEERFLFRRPFKLKDLRVFLEEEFKVELDIIFQKAMISLDGISTELDIDENIFNNVLMGLLSQIGDEGEVIITDNIYQDLIRAFSGKKFVILYSKGYIIKKVGEYYAIYYVHCTNNQIMVTSKPMSVEEVQELFKKNPDNLNVLGLSEFCGIPRGRS